MKSLRILPPLVVAVLVLPLLATSRAALAETTTRTTAEDSVAPCDGAPLVDVGGHRLRYRLLGKGSPLFLFDAGMADSADSWGGLPDQLAAHTRVLLYDRAGIGCSELGPEPRTAAAVGRDLAALLTALAITEPIVLVGHSLAGLHIRAFAAQFPERVAALAFLDPTTEGMHQSLASETEREKMMAQLAAESPGVQAEGRALWPRLLEVGALAAPPDVPALVITGLATPEIPEAWREQAAAMGVDVPKMFALQATKLRLHKALAARLPYSEHVVAAKSHHYVHLDEPELVLDRLLALRERAVGWAERHAALSSRALGILERRYCTPVGPFSIRFDRNKVAGIYAIVPNGHLGTIVGTITEDRITARWHEAQTAGDIEISSHDAWSGFVARYRSDLEPERWYEGWLGREEPEDRPSSFEHEGKRYLCERPPDAP